MGNYKFIDHTADIAVKVFGDSIEDLFYGAAEAFNKILLGDSVVQPVENIKTSLEAGSLEELLVDFLSEINFLLTVKSWVIGKVDKLDISQKNGKWRLSSDLQGEALSQNHSVEVEIKAVTYHQLEIEQIDGKYQTLLIFDI